MAKPSNRKGRRKAARARTMPRARRALPERLEAGGRVLIFAKSPGVLFDGVRAWQGRLPIIMGPAGIRPADYVLSVSMFPDEVAGGTVFAASLSPAGKGPSDGG